MKAELDTAQLEVTHDMVRCRCCGRRYSVRVYLDLKSQNTQCGNCKHVQAYNPSNLNKKLAE